MIYTKLYATASAATDVTAAAPFDTGDCLPCGIQAVFTGSDVVGTFKLQGSIDGATFVDIPNASTSVTGSASTILGFIGYYRWVRFQWDYTSGTGNLTVYAFAKQSQVYE